MMPPGELAAPAALAAAIAAIEAWLLDQGLTGRTEADLVAGLVERLLALGLPLDRFLIGSGLLHPTVGGRGYRWRIGEGVVEVGYNRTTYQGDGDPEWLQSPFRYMLDRGLLEFRRQLEHDHRPGEFPIVDDFEAEGVTDYVVLGTSFGDQPAFGPVRGLFTSLTTKRAGGFGEAELDLVRRLFRPAALAYKAISAASMTRTLLCTYLGNDAADHVLAGSIDRGQAETIQAAIWFSDLEGFTRLADTLPREQLIPFLNAYVEDLVAAIHAHGGQVLKFVGDGMLAIFPVGGPAAVAPSAAIEAAIDAQRRADRLLAERTARGEPVARCFIGLHLGEVLYGNIGSPERLDFTVLGPAVNETARIERMCRTLEQPIVISQSLANAACGDRLHLVSLGRYMLRGVARAQELFTLDPDHD